jgi:hypothetical protein
MDDDEHRKPHPHSPSGGGGPGAFRQSGPIGLHKHNWAGRDSGTDLDVLNIRVPRELSDHPGWAGTPDSTHRRGMFGGAGNAAALFRILVVYDPKTSNGSLYVLGKQGNKEKIALKGAVVVGGNDHITPTGNFHASYWETDHVSNKYGWKADTPWSNSPLGINAFGP